MTQTNDWKYCAVGNITEVHLDGNGILRHGSPAFTGGTKVYLCGKNWYPELGKISVIGLNRGKQYQCVDTDPALIEHVRCQRVFKPTVLEMMYEHEYRDVWWGQSKQSKQNVDAFVAQWNQHFGQNRSDTARIIKIQAVRRACYPDLMARYENPMEHPCDVQEGQFWYSVDGKRPDGFCDSAWETLAPFVQELARGGGNFFDGWMKNPRSALLSCNDGFRPVSFYIEVLEGDHSR